MVHQVSYLKTGIYLKITKILNKTLQTIYLLFSLSEAIMIMISHSTKPKGIRFPGKKTGLDVLNCCIIQVQYIKLKE